MLINRTCWTRSGAASALVVGNDAELTPKSAAVTAKSDDELNRMLGNLQLTEFVYEQPAVGDVEYSFKHALTQEVAYSSVLIERRKQLHERAGQAIETLFAEQLDDHLNELVRHYGRCDNTAKAVEYLGRAGEQAARRSAYVDAFNRLTAAIDLLHKFPDGPEQNQQELALQLALGPALIAVKGRTAPEVERAYNRAVKLCERLGDPPELFPALFGLWLLYFLRAELSRAYELAEQLLRRAQSAHDPVLQLYAHVAIGNTSYAMGELLRAREHGETAITLYDPKRHRPLMLRYLGTDAGVYCLASAAWTLWHLGYPDQAIKRANEALELAQGLSHPFTRALAESFTGVVRQYRGETRAVLKHAENTIAFTGEYQISNFFDYATMLRGWVMAKPEHREEGIAQIRETLTRLSVIGAELRKSYFLCLLVEACMEVDRLGDALNALGEAFTAIAESEERIYHSEIHRLKGELLLRQDNSNLTEAQNSFQRAIEIARTQSAKSLELRATISLARLLRDGNRRDEAHTMLAEIYNWFTEGFDTADVKDAKALLGELQN